MLKFSSLMDELFAMVRKLRSFFVGSRDADMIENNIFEEYGVLDNLPDSKNPDALCQEKAKEKNVFADAIVGNEEPALECTGCCKQAESLKANVDANGHELPIVEVDAVCEDRLAGKETLPAKVSISQQDERIWSELVEIVNEFDHFKSLVSNSDTKQVVEMMQLRLVSLMERHGLEAISNDASFDNDRHVSFPLEIVEDGTPVASFLRHGIIREGKVLLKAVVKICKDENMGQL